MTVFRTICMPRKPEKGLDGEKRAYFIIIHGLQLGEIFAIDNNESIIGRDEMTDFCIKDPAISRNHMKILCEKDSIKIKDLDSTNGIYVNDEKKSEAILEDGDRIVLGGTHLKFSYTDTLEEEFYKDFYKLATRDGLTNTINKSYIMELFERELSRSRRHKKNISIMMLDIDFFKKVNDTYGHLAGDYVLREITKIISKKLREEDLFGRYGGEEFLILLPDTSVKKAQTVAEKIRQIIEQKVLRYNDMTIQVTVSIGVAAFSKELQTTELLLARADHNLYTAKASGRNCVLF
ncbi:diguanylate cyclase [Chlamydiota bacterium]